MSAPGGRMCLTVATRTRRGECPMTRVDTYRYRGWVTPIEAWPRERSILVAMADHEAKYGRPPTIREMVERTEYLSTAAVHIAIQRLKVRGLVAEMPWRDSNRRYTLSESGRRETWPDPPPESEWPLPGLTAAPEYHRGQWVFDVTGTDV